MSLTLNGLNQKVTIPYSAPIGSPLTLFAFIRPAKVNAAGTLFSINSTSLLSASVATEISFSKKISGFQTGIANLLTGQVNTNLGWQRIALTSNNGKLTVFVNNIENKASVTGAFSSTTTDVLALGAKVVTLGVFGSFFGGEVSNFRAWSRELTDRQILQLMQAFSISDLNDVMPDKIVAALNLNNDLISAIPGLPDGSGDGALDGINPLPPDVGGRHPKTQRPVKLFPRKTT